MSQKQLNNYVNDPKRTDQLFRLENGPRNSSHRDEMPGNGNLDRIKSDMRDFLNGN